MNKPFTGPHLLSPGVLPDDRILALVESGAICAPPLSDGQVQPSSIDLRLGSKAYRLRASFLPSQASVEDIIADVALHSFDIAGGAVLETEAVYLVELQEYLALPAIVGAKANPKSSTGRLDVFVRLLADHASAFDAVPVGYMGKLWLEIAPKTFPVLVRPGTRLSQLRFHVSDTRLSDGQLQDTHRETPLVDGNPVFRDGLCVGLDLGRPGEVFGWRARRHAGIVDMDRAGAYPREQFWEPLAAAGPRGALLEPDEFYILCSREAVVVPPGLAAEMVPFDAGVGEFRAHYAGFFDPGFGYGPGNASRAVLEVRVRDVPFLVGHGQVVAKLGYERMIAPPSSLYGQNIKSNYQGQGLRLSKHFA